MKSILINGHTYHEGDQVLAELIKEQEPRKCEDLIDWYYHNHGNGKEDPRVYSQVRGILNIQDDERCYICQNALTGADNANNHYGKHYSWSVNIRDGRIISSDTKWINPVVQTPSFIVEEVPQLVDDDPMPDDWQLPYPIPEHL